MMQPEELPFLHYLLSIFAGHGGDLVTKLYGDAETTASVRRMRSLYGEAVQLLQAWLATFSSTDASKLMMTFHVVRSLVWTSTIIALLSKLTMEGEINGKEDNKIHLKASTTIIDMMYRCVLDNSCREYFTSAYLDLSNYIDAVRELSPSQRYR